MDNKIENSVLKKIKNGEIKMKPRWWFVSEIWGIKIAYWLIVFIGALGAGTLFYFFDLYRPTELSEYGELGWGLILEDFPKWGTAGLVVCVIIGGLITVKIGENYKKNFWTIIGTTALTVTVIAIIFFLLKIGI